MITKAAIVNGFMVNGEMRFDVLAVINGELPADKLNEELGRFEIVAEDLNFLGEWECSLIGVEFGDDEGDGDDENGEGGGEDDDENDEESGSESEEVYRKKISEAATLVVDRVKDENGEYYVWRLFGSTPDGLYWETDDYEAASLEEAIADAEEYLAEWEATYPGE